MESESTFGLFVDALKYGFVDTTGVDVLFVGTDPRVAEALKRQLLLSQVQFHQVETVAQACSALLDTPYVMVICETTLKDGEAWQVLDFLSTCGYESLFALVRGNDEETSLRVARYGAAALLSNPPTDLNSMLAIRSLVRIQMLQRENQELTVKLRQEQVDVVVSNAAAVLTSFQIMARAIDARDAYTHAHSTSVAKLAKCIGQFLNMDFNAQEDLEEAGSVHDIGKIGVPEAILRKPGRLTDDEYHIIQRHAEHGADILTPMAKIDRSKREIIAAVRGHHERFDGRGYPDHLAGEDIPLYARILSVCDTWDAMVTNRPYRPGMPWNNARAIISAASGTQFDPQLVKAFLAYFEEKPETFYELYHVKM